MQPVAAKLGSPVDPSRDPSLVASVCMLLGIGAVLVDVIVPRGVAMGMFYAVVVLVAARARSERLVVAVTALCSVLMVLGYFVSAPGAEGWIPLINRGLALLVAWTVAGITSQRIRMRRAHDEAQAQLKVLHGLLPICSSCKKIRDDEAEGAWQPLESYISSHSEAHFTHSICPDCTKELYGLIIGEPTADVPERSAHTPTVRPWRPAYRAGPAGAEEA